MLAPSGAAKATHVVSIREENNTEREIPRYRREDKPKLWTSKLEIHHNMMMEKIRVMVQQKLLEEVASNDDFFTNMDALAIENDDDNSWHQEQKQQKQETEEDILLAKKARILQNLLNDIMELPKDDILLFLTSSSLPAGLSGSSAKTNQQQAQKELKTLSNTAGDDSDVDSTESTNDKTEVDDTHPMEGNDKDGLTDERDGNGSIDSNQNEETYRQQDDQDDNYGYNWIMDCNDAWSDLPPVVQVNAVELGYTEKFWDEDYQDLPVFRTLWKDLTPNQHTAAVFLGNYDEETWDEDVRMLLMTTGDLPLSLIPEDIQSEREPIAETPSSVPSPETPTDKQSSDETTNTSQNDSRSTSDSTINTTTTEASVDQDDNDDDVMFNDFVSNFAAEINEEEEPKVKRNAISEQKSDDQEVVAKKARVDTRDKNKEEETMMDEFLSNFAASTEDMISDNEKNSEVESFVNTGKLGRKNEEEIEATTDESLSKEDDVAAISIENNNKKGSVGDTSSLDPKNEDEDEDEEEAMMDKFISNFVSTKENDEADSDNDKNVKRKTLVNTSNLVPKDEDEEEAMMDEFLSNFVATTDDDKADSDNEKNFEKESSVNTDNLDPKNEDDEEAMMDEFLSNFVATIDDDEAESDNEKNFKKESTVNTDNLDPKNEDDEEAMMDEFLSNFVATTDDDEADSDNEKNFKKESTVNTGNLDAKNEDEEEAMMDDSLSNFAASRVDETKVNPEKENSVPTTGVLSSDDKDEAAIMDEFVSNFDVLAKEDDKTDSDNMESLEKENLVPTTSVLPIDDNDEAAMMDEFVSNFVVSAKEDEKVASNKKESREKESLVPTASVLSNDDEDENDDTAIMDEFVSNFVVSAKEDYKIDLDEQIPEKESLVATASVISDNDDEEEKGDTAIMNDFVSNFSESEEQEQEDCIDSTNQKTPQHYGSVATSGIGSKDRNNITAMVGEFQANHADEDRTNSGKNEKSASSTSFGFKEENNLPQHQSLAVDNEETPLVSKPREISMDRGFEDEESPLIPSKERTEEQMPDTPVSAWETYSPYLYWVPVVIVAPIVYWNRR